MSYCRIVCKDGDNGLDSNASMIAHGTILMQADEFLELIVVKFDE